MAKNLIYFISGASTAASLFIALFFLRAWTKTQDRLFFNFSFAFAAFGFEKIVLALMQSTSEYRPYVFIFRLAAFLAIILAIFEKNIKRKA
jgi:hypothetical protein